MQASLTAFKGNTDWKETKLTAKETKNYAQNTR